MGYGRHPIICANSKSYRYLAGVLPIWYLNHLQTITPPRVYNSLMWSKASSTLVVRSFLPLLTRKFNAITSISWRSIRTLFLNGHFENSFPFFVIVSAKRQKFHQHFLIFLETSTRSYHHTLSAFMGVIGSKRCQERVGSLCIFHVAPFEIDYSIHL